MGIEQVSDENYETFRNSPRAALVVTTSYCKACAGYAPIIETISKQMSYIRFGKIVIDKDRSIQLKRQYPDLSKWLLPTTLFFREGNQSYKINGTAPYPKVVKDIKENLILGSRIYVLNANGVYTPALLKNIRENNESYLVELTEDCNFGRKGSRIELPADKFSWDKK